jgi:hypothetical protein
MRAPMTPRLDRQLGAKVALRRLDLEVAKLIASRLAEQGFHVVKTTQSGVYIEGSPTDFERVFKTRVMVDPSPHFESRPELAVWGGGEVASIYFPSTPQRFG